MDPLRAAMDSVVSSVPRAGFLPHGYCFVWDPGLIGLHVVSDAIIALSYFSIPIVLVVFYLRRKEEGLVWVLGGFAAFIVACGTTHLLSIYTLWVPDYWTDGAVKAVTALLSASTAVILWPLLPRLLAIPSPMRLQAANLALHQEIERRKAMEVDLRRAQEEQQAELIERRRMEHRFRQLVEFAPHAQVIVNAAGTIERINSQTVQWFGYSRDELLGKPVEVLIPERFRPRHPGFLKGFTSAPTLRPMGTGRDLYGLRKDGTEFPVDISLSPIETDEGLQIIASIVDMTERRRVEQDLKRTNMAYEAVNSELESFAYSVSHDLRAPVRSMLGFSQILLEDHAPKLEPEAKDHLGRIIRASARMSELIDGLLVLSRITREEVLRDEVDLGAIAGQVVDDLSKTDPGRKVDFIATKGIRAMGDPRLLRVLLNNLLSNAWKFTGKTPHARIEFEVSQGVSGPVYCVRDNGAGFDMAYADKLFGAFQRLHDQDEFPGTGIGLATAQRIVTRHGGRLWAEGAVGAGATFHFTLSA
jgi:PAS domain S-box-containing protein